MMSKTLQWITAILFGIVLGIALFTVPYYLGVRHGEKRTIAKFAPHTDTLYLPKDTIIYKPVEVIKWRTRKDTVRLALIDTLYTTDSVLVEVPIEQKVYKDTSYTAYVSGFRASLDSIRLTQPTIVITTTVQELAPICRKLGFGITAGPSVLYDGQVRAGVGASLGLTYKF